MAKSKRTEPEFNLHDSLKEIRDKYDAWPLKAVQGWVTEQAPSYDDGYGYDIKPKAVQVSPVFQDKTEAAVDKAIEKWLNEHEPDTDQHKFSVSKRYLRTVTEDRWGYL